MSGLLDSARSGVTSPDVGKATNDAPKLDTEAVEHSVPRSVPDHSELGSQVGDITSGNEEGEMVPAAGKINEKGEVIDDEGNAIGKVTTGNAEKFVGFIVTQEGDVLDKEGEIVGKAEPLEDVASELNYTTQSAKDDVEKKTKTGGGLGGALGGITSGAQSLLGGVTGGLGKTTQGVTDTAGHTLKGVTDTAGHTVKGATDTVGDATGTKDITGAVGDTTKGLTDTVGDTAQGATDTVGDTTKGATDTVGDVTKGATDTVGGVAEGAGDTVEGLTTEGPEGALDGVKKTADGAVEGVQDTAGGATEGVQDTAGDAVDGAKDTAGDAVEGVQDTAGDAVEGVQDTAEGALDEEAPIELKDQVEGGVDELGDKLDEVPKAISIPEFAPSVAEKVVGLFEGPFNIAEDGQVTDQNGKILGKLAEGQELEDLAGKEITGIDGEGNLLGENGSILGKVEFAPEGSIVEKIKEEVPEAGDRLDALEEAKKLELPSLSILEGLKINKAGNVVDENGNPLGKVKSGDLKKMVGMTPDAEGKVWDNRGNVIGEVEVLPEAVQNIAAPFEDFPDAVVDKNGKIVFEGRQVGVVVGDDWKDLIGKKVDADGDILDKNGNVIGKAERGEAEEPIPEPEPEPEAIDFSILRGNKINKMGNVVDDRGNVVGHVVQGILKHLIGKKVGENGEIFNDAGQVIGKAEPIPENEREDASEPAPFEDFPGAVVADKGKVMFNGEQVGIVVEGDEKKLKGKTVDADGDILDKAGNRLGRAERWEEDEPEPEPEIDMSSLAGKRVNKAGNCVDSHGDIYGRVVEGDLKRLVGKMCDKNGFIRNEGGDVIGKAELIPEAEREGMKEGPFTELPGCTVNKEGKVVTPGGDVVGRLVSGDPKVLFGRAVDDDGDILDKNGNVLGHAERWEEPEVPKDVNPMSGRRVNRKGEVVDENGDIIGKLTSGELSQCAGKKIDDDGDVIDQKGSILGHCSLLEDIPEPEPEDTETEEEKQKKAQLEQDRKIAGTIATCIEQSLDKIRPICKMITNLIDKAERTPEEERDEEELVKQVRPLIEEGGKILTEANGVIRGLDPDGRISANAKHKTAAREATPEEYRLADLLKELTGTVTETIENAKRKIEDMPHAKKELNPLWGLLAEPLFQILAAVGLLLSGVLGLVGKLLDGLGLGGIVNNLLGGLGLTRVLEGLGLGKVISPLTGGDKKKKNGGGGGGGLLGGVL